MKKVISTLQAQGGKNVQAVFNTLVKSGLATEEASPHNVAALIVAVTAPPFVPLEAYVLERLSAANEQGATFGEVFQFTFQLSPQHLKVSQVAICTTHPWMRIHFFSGEVLEFCSLDSVPQGIRGEVIFSGGVIAAVSMKLNGPVTTTSGWADSRPE